MDTELHPRDPTLGEVAVHPRHAAEARDFCFKFARHVMVDYLVLALFPVFMISAYTAAQALAGTGGSEWAWRGRLLCALLGLHGAYAACFPYGLTPRRLSMKVGGLRTGGRIVRTVDPNKGGTSPVASRHSGGRKEVPRRAHGRAPRRPYFIRRRPAAFGFSL